MNQSKKVIEYFNQCHTDYNIIWKTYKNHSLHYGFHDAKNTTHHQAVINMNRVLATLAKIKPNEKVLDCGCGVGGSSVWIAKNIGAIVTGININDMQIRLAKEFAKQQQVEEKVTILKRDFTRENFPKNSFDVVYGVESICYANDKRAFLNKAKKMLKKNGRIIIADLFLRKEEESPDEKAMIETWLEGWAVPNQSTVKEFKRALEKEGFKNIKCLNATKNIFSSAKRLYLASIINYPIAKILELLKIRTSVQTGNVISAYCQYKALKKDLWTYGIFYAEKP